MGASTWIIEVDFEENLEEAFSKARRTVFESGQYYKRPKMEVGDYDSFADNYPPDYREDLGEVEMRAMYDEFKNEADVDSAKNADEALRFSGEDGTHSIIDISQFSRVNPFSDTTLEKIFGTLTPSVDAIRSEKTRLFDEIGRWQCRYCVAHEDEKKSKIVFVGISGD